MRPTALFASVSRYNRSLGGVERPAAPSTAKITSKTRIYIHLRLWART